MLGLSMRKVAVIGFSILTCVGIFLGPVYPVSAAKDYGYPTLSSRPTIPDVRAYEGALVQFPPWRHLVSPDTFSYDVYFENGCWKKSFPIRIGRYWQLSDICEYRPKSFFNKAAAEVNKSWIISYHYQDAELRVLGGIFFPEESLKIVFSDDHGESWTMLRTSVVDPVNNTVAALTDKPGGYMVMAGFVSPGTFYNYNSNVQGVSSDRLLQFAESTTGLYAPVMSEYLLMVIKLLNPFN